MKIGFLPLYVKLYDDIVPELRPRLESFYDEIADTFTSKGAEVVKAPFCRLETEFKDSVKLFEDNNVDAIVTLHMAYSPSLECVDALAGTKLPIVVLDTTSTLEFTNMQDPGEIMYCHGVHGVMDMCSMLTRRGKDYAIAAGHYTESNVIDKALGFVKAAKAAKSLNNSKVAMIGGLFDGMGDFRVPNEELLERFGITVVEKSKDDMISYINSVTDDEIKAEYALDKERYDFDGEIVEEEYLTTIKSCLAVRKCLEKEEINSFTANFKSMGIASGVPAMPFLEACRSMEKGIGYAGEGDPLTASFTGALLQGYPETSFVEIFCPDWKNNMLFLSHMGEMNYRIAATKPSIQRIGTNYAEGSEYPYPGYARMKGGKGIFVNICKDAEKFKLIITEGEMVDYDKDNFTSSIRGWMKLNTDCGKFLEDLSKNGGTHHSVFVYGATIDELDFFGKLLNLETVII